MAELAGVLVGDYFLLECMAREGTVETYRARPTTRGGVDVVLRLFRPEFPDPTSFREHFAAEIEKVWRCHHEHIQPLLEFGTGDELLYCATLMPEGETLEQILARYPRQPLPVAFIASMMMQLCSALQCVHEQGIVHGNIQPSSILVDKNEQVLLTHFGMRRAYQEGEPLVSQIDEGNAAYVAPEQALGMTRPASDIYALGVLLYRLLGGVLPYEDNDPGEIAIKHANEPIPSLRMARRDISEELELVVRVALAKTTEARFATPAALAEALQAALTPDTPQVVSSTPERRIPVRSRRTHLPWSRVSSFFMLFVLLTGLLGASFFIFSLPQHIYNLRNLPFLGLSQAGIGVVTPTQVATTVRGMPTGTPNGVTPVTGSTKSTPIAGISPTPIVNGTVDVTPATTSTPLPTSCSEGAMHCAPTCVAGSLSIDGSQSVGSLLQQLDSDYQAYCSGLSFTLGGSGSRAGLNAVQQQHIDVASSDLTARPTRNLTDHPFAAMLYAVIVSSDVGMSSLSSAMLQGIYSGKITNWSQVGGPDEPIRVFQRPAVDTVTAIFRAFVLNGENEHVKGTRLKQDWAQAVAATQGAISYVPLMDAQNANVTVLAIDGIRPGLTSLQQGSYPFWSVEHLYTRGNGTSQFRAYLSFLKSTQEVPVFAQFSALPVSMMPSNIVSSHLPGPEI